MGLNILIYNMLFFLLLLWNQRNNTNNAVVKYLLFAWLLSSAFSIMFYVDDPTKHPDITLIPYLYLQICFLISIYPIARFNEESLADITVARPKWLLYLMVLLSVVSILPFIENLIHLLFAYSKDNSDILFDMYIDKMSNDVDVQLVTWLSYPGKLCNAVTLRFEYLTPLLLFYYLTQEKINKYLLTGLILALFNPVVHGFSVASRGAMVLLALNLIFLFILFRKQIPYKRRKKILITGSILFFLGLISLSVLTIVRFKGHEIQNTMLSFVSLYIGEGSVNFSNLMWDNLREHTQGDNSFSFFKQILGFDTFSNYLDRREYWGEGKVGIPVHIFYTYIGDWFSDLGVIGTLSLVIFLSVLVRKITKVNDSISLLSLYGFMIFCNIILQGFTYFTMKTNISGVMFGMLVVFLISYDFNKLREE